MELTKYSVTVPQTTAHTATATSTKKPSMLPVPVYIVCKT